MSKIEYYNSQSFSFKAGFDDYRFRKINGMEFSESMNAEWKRGWKWAESNLGQGI